MNRQELIELLQNAQESLSVEIKRWLSPEDAIQAATIARTLIALKNFDGGILILGLDNRTGESIMEGRPVNLRELYHIDKMQAMIGRLARPSFEIEIHFVPRGDADFPVIVVPGGVRAPVIARSTVRETSGKTILEQNAVYVRCLANDTPSSSKPVTHRDWDELFGRCFANREVDVGQFIQRHIPNLLNILQEQRSHTPSPVVLSQGEETNNSKAETSLTVTQEVQRSTFEFLKYGSDRFEERVRELRSGNTIPILPEHGSWEVAFTLAEHQLDLVASDDFLSRLFINQPRYTGWPCWIDSRNFADQRAHPYPYDHGWEALIIRLEQTFFYNHIDFWRIEPRGRFYQRRALEDDIEASRGNQRLPALQLLDFLLVIARVAEAIGVGLQFARALGCDVETTILSFVFRWKKLKGRRLASWAEPGRTLFPSSEAIQDEVVSFTEVPLETELAKISYYVRQATRDVFEVFGKEFKEPIYDEICAKTLQRSA
jgi:Putative DNA-binding domain